MIRVSEAFTPETTEKLLMHVYLEGHWSDKNQWVPDGYTPPLTVYIRALPTKDLRGEHGETLQAESLAERITGSYNMKSKIEMPVNSIVIFDEKQYKFTDRGNYSAAGFWAATATAIATGREVELPTDGDKTLYDDLMINYAGTMVPVSRFMRF